jgi:putative phosphoribosyl transferase
MRFRDRIDAGRQLAERLSYYRDENPIILALPRGGVVVGFEVAQMLRAPLDVIIARKIGAPDQPELGIGALAPGGVRILDERIIQLLGISEEQIARVEARERGEIDRRLRLYRGDRPMPQIQGQTAILVDDGIATGVTARAAIQSIRRQEPRRIVLAVPVAPPETIHLLRKEVNDAVCLMTPPDLRAISLWYDNFEQTSDDEVIRLLQRSWTKSETEHT